MLLLFSLYIGLTVGIQTEFRTVRTSFGSIRGKRIDSYGAQSGFVFAGLPIAEPPIGRLRFKAPVDPKPWEGVLDTYQYKNACISDPKNTYKKEGWGPVSEDCLYLNLFTSRTCLEKGNCSVLAVLHGGGLKYQSPVSFRMEVLINNFANDERNIIVVFLPYRMGAMGVLHMSEMFTTSADTNVLMRDIQQGLKWIQREIIAFGGNKDRVSLFGHSGGGLAARFAMLSPQFNNLFSQAIAMSAPNPGADISKSLTKDRRLLFLVANTRMSWKISKIVGCATEKDTFEEVGRVEEIIACLREIPQYDILKAQLDTLYNDIEVLWGPWCDNDITPNYMEEATKQQRNMNLLMGSVSYEFMSMRHAFDQNGKLMNERIIEACWHIAYLMNYENPLKFIEYCLSFYGSENRFMFFEDDRTVHYAVGHHADAINRAGGKAFVYSYAYADAGKIYDKYTDRGGRHPDHTEDYIYVFGLHRNDESMTPRDYEIERIYSGMIANFVNFGDPSYGMYYKWDEWDPAKKNYFKIDFDDKMQMPGMKDNFYRDVYRFYDEIIPRKAGKWIPLTDFPKQGDLLMFTDIFSGLVAYWTNTTFEKGVKSQTASYWMWKKHVEHLESEWKLQRKAVFRGEVFKDDLRTGETEAVTSTKRGLDASTLLVLIALFGFIIVFFVKVFTVKTKNGYEALHGQ